MKTIKFTLMLSLILFSIQIFSQNKSPQERATNQTRNITKTCGLSKDQQPRVEQILLTSIEKMDALKEQQTTQKEKHQQEIKSINDREDMDMRATLTPDQYQKYITAKEEAKAKAEEKAKERAEEKANGQTNEAKQQPNNQTANKPPINPQQKAANQLKNINKTCNLTKDQMPKVEQILLTSITALENAKKEETAFRETHSESVKAVSNEEESQLKSVMTPMQYQKYIDMKEARKERKEQKH